MKKIFVLFLFTLFVSACASKPVTQTDLYDSDEDRYLKNIVVKEKSENKMVYEYKDVRIDEISSLAAKHCNQYGKRAFLEQTSLFRNNRMRATFVCAILQ